MKLQLRRGLFETNSSSTHCITMCMEDEWNRFKKGDMYWDNWDAKLIPVTLDSRKQREISEENGDNRIMTYEEYNEYINEYYEDYVSEYVTPSGEKVIAFGYYGYGG